MLAPGRAVFAVSGHRVVKGGHCAEDGAAVVRVEVEIVRTVEAALVDALVAVLEVN